MKNKKNKKNKQLGDMNFVKAKRRTKFKTRNPPKYNPTI